MNKHTLTLLGEAGGELRVPVDVLLEALGVLVDGARQAARFVVEGESTRKGPRPAWLDAASRFDITGLTAGSAIISIEVPTLREADPVRFGAGGQGVLFDEEKPDAAGCTAVELFADVLTAALQDDSEDVMADRMMLDTCVRFARLAGQLVDGLRLDGLHDRAASVLIRREHLRRFEALRDTTPEPHAVRVSGVLDTISASRSDILLRMQDGAKVSARLAEHDPELLHKFFGTRVVASGRAHFRPSGRLLLVDIEELAAAREADAMFERIPIARSGRPVALIAPQDERSGVAAFFGTWPGDESDDDLLNALKAIE